MELVSCSKQTKEWRLKQKGYGNGKNNWCEKNQVIIFNKIIENKINTKSSLRINFEKNEIEKIRNPLYKENGFEYSEDFDGFIKIKNKNILINFKMCIGSGGAQTRTLREVYHFIKYQICLIKKNKYNDYIFINILDGDQFNKHIKKFLYLTKNLNEKEKKKIYIGDLYNFKNVYNNYF